MYTSLMRYDFLNKIIYAWSKNSVFVNINKVIIEDLMLNVVFLGNNYIILLENVQKIQYQYIILQQIKS
jgi:hypothetical protein